MIDQKGVSEGREGVLVMIDQERGCVTMIDTEGENEERKGVRVMGRKGGEREEDEKEKGRT